MTIEEARQRIIQIGRAPHLTTNDRNACIVAAAAMGIINNEQNIVLNEVKRNLEALIGEHLPIPD